MRPLKYPEEVSPAGADAAPPQAHLRPGTMYIVGLFLACQD